MQPEQPKAGFLTPDGRLVWSVRYTLESEPPSIVQLIVPLNRDGNSLNGKARPSGRNKRMVDVRPGDTLWHGGSRYTVKAVEAYRWVKDGRSHGADHVHTGYPRDVNWSE